MPELKSKESFVRDLVNGLVKNYGGKYSKDFLLDYLKDWVDEINAAYNSYRRLETGELKPPYKIEEPFYDCELRELITSIACDL